MDKIENTSTIVCDDCGAQFESSTIEFKHAETKIDGKQFEIVYYTCSSCGRAYVVCMLDYWGRKLQNKYVSAMDSYRAAYHKNTNPVKIQQKLQKVEDLKKDALKYQNEVLHKYGKLIPEGLLV